MYVDDDSPVSITTSSEEADELITTDDLEIDFAITTDKIKQALNNSPKPIDVISVVQQLRATSAVKDRNVPLYDDEVFENVTTIEKLWQKLSKFWSIFDYDLLVFLLKIINRMEANEIFKEFLSRIDISRMEKIDLVLHFKVFKREGSMKPLLRIKVGAEKCTRFIETEVRKIVSSIFNLNEYVLRLKDIKQGCIEIVYEISNAMMSYFLYYKCTGYDLAEFAAHNIISLHINDMELQIPVLSETNKVGNCMHINHIMLYSNHICCQYIYTIMDDFTQLTINHELLHGKLIQNLRISTYIYTW